MSDSGRLENDFFCRKIFEIAVKMKLDMYPTAMLATSIYHRSSEAMSLPKDCDTRYVLAATSLLLAAKSDDHHSSIDSDDVLLHFYPLFFHEELDLVHPGPEYESVSTLMVQITWLIFYKLDFDIRCKLPGDCLHQLLLNLQPLLTDKGLSKFNIPKAAWTLISDFHLLKQSVLFKPEYIAIAALNVIFRSIQILNPGSPTPDIMNCIMLYDEDATPETILPIVDAILAQNAPVLCLQERTLEIPPAVAATPPPLPPPEIEETMSRLAVADK